MLAAFALAAALSQGAAPAPVAKVVAFKRPVSVVSADKKERQLTASESLLESDTVKVGPGGLAVLQLLKNDYLVRVDDDLELPVREIVLLNAPRAGKSVNEQLEQLLTTGERADSNNRVAGWVSELHGGTAPGIDSEKKPGVVVAAPGGSTKPQASTSESGVAAKAGLGDSTASSGAGAVPGEVPKKNRVDEEMGEPPRSRAPALSPPPPVVQPSPVAPSPPAQVPAKEVAAVAEAAKQQPKADKAEKPVEKAKARKAPVTEASVKKCLAAAISAADPDLAQFLKGKKLKVTIRQRGTALTVAVPGLTRLVPDADKCLDGWTRTGQLEVKLE